MKPNAVKWMGQRVLAFSLALVLFMQTAPLTAIIANAQEIADVPTETETSVEKTNPETEGAELVDETTVTESETNPQDLLNTAQEGTVSITSADQLVSGVPAGSTYVLANDIVMGGDQQIGLVAGVLDGAGHTITLNGKALVNELTGTIQNLLVDGKATLGMGQGTIACTVKGGTIQNCASLVTIDPGWDSNQGGLAGNLENAKIYNSFFAGAGKDMFGLVANNGIFCSSNNSAAHSQIKNCYYTEGNSVGSGFAWNRDDTSNGKKSPDEMKTAEFVQLLNASNVGSGYIWAAEDGAFPKLIPGGSALEPADKSALKSAIQEAQSKNEGDYTNETWAPMQEALRAAVQIDEKIDATQDEVNAAATALQNAIAALKEKVRNLSPVEPPKEGILFISNQDDLARIDGNNPKAFYQLTQDITIKDNFLSPNLAGVLDGNGHTITIRTASPLFGTIVETGVVQNLRVKVEGIFTNRQKFAPFAENLKGGMIVNCISEVTGQHSAGYVRKMEDGVLVNCLTMGHNRRGAFVYFQKSTDHQNIDGYKSGKFYNCYWSASNSVENINPETNLIHSEPVGDKRLRSAEFIAQLNNQKGEFGATWGRDVDGYPYFGADQGDAIIDGSKNRYDVQFVWHDQQILTVENGTLQLSPQMTGSNRFAGTFQLKDVPQDSTITWSCEDRTQQEIMQLGENGDLYVFYDGGGVVRAMEHKADGTEELAAEIRVVSASREIEQLQLLLDGEVIHDAVTVQGSAVNSLEIQAKYAGSDTFQTLPSYLVELNSENPELLRTYYNTASFYFRAPGTSKLTVTEKTEKENPVSITISVTSAYVPVEKVQPAISGTEKIHYRNSMGSGQFISIPQTVLVVPANASYKNDIVVTSSDPEIAQYDGSGYTPYKNGTVTFTAKLNDNGNVVEGTSTVTFIYTNPLTEVTAPAGKITLEQGTKQTLPLSFKGQPGNLHEITEPDLIWTFDKKGIVSIQRPNHLMQIRGTGGPDYGNWVASNQFVVTALRPGTVVATGTPVDTTGGAKPVKLTITVNGDGSAVNEFDIPKFIETGKKSAIRYLKENNTFAFGEEWSIFTLLRDGQTLPQQQLDSYYNDVVTTVHSWNANILATEVERTAMALNIMGKDITNIDGVNLVEMICNHPDLTKQGSNSLAWALIALDMNNTEIPADMKWSRERIVTELLRYQHADGGFGLNLSGISSVDVTAMSIQALARYQKQDDVAAAIDRGMAYLAKATEKNLNLGNSESIAQIIITLAVLNRDIVAEPGFGDELENIMSALSEYMVEGEGFKHAKNGSVDKMATMQAMQALCAYERFLNGESSYWNLQGTGPIDDPAAKVSSMIAALPEQVSAADAELIQQARDAYNALTESQKKRVTNLDRLIQAEKALAEVLAVQQVIDAIDALPEDITLADAYFVKSARDAFDQLTPAQQSKVTNLNKLESAEATLQKLLNADSVMGMIENLPENITLADTTAVQAARAAYDLLSKEQQAQVTNLDKLEHAEAKLEELNSAQQVQQVMDAIDALPEHITVENEAAVQAVRDAYNRLTAAQQAQVSNVNKLLAAEKAITDQKAAAQVDRAIQALSNPVSIADKQAVQDARSAYEKLSTDQKALVKNLDRLILAESEIKDLDAAQLVMGMIKDLPVNLTAKDEQAVKAARSAYETLTEKQQSLVLNLYILERAEQLVAEKKAVQEVEDAIDALPEVIGKEHSEAIKAARAAYNDLSPELRALVRNVDKLLNAEKALKSLRKPMDKPIKHTKWESNVVEAVVKDGVVSAKQLAAIQGEDLILRIEGTMESGEAYTLSIYGKDILKAEDLYIGMNREGLYETEIHKLSENPEIFRFLQSGAFPCSMMVEMETTLDDGEYLLLRYDPVQQRAVLVSRVQAEDGKVQFIVQEGGEYFIAKKASKKSIPELEKTEEISVAAQPETSDVKPETLPVQQKEEPSNPVIWIWIPLLLLVGCGVIVVYQKKKEHKGE